MKNKSSFSKGLISFLLLSALWLGYGWLAKNQIAAGISPSDFFNGRAIEIVVGLLLIIFTGGVQLIFSTLFILVGDFKTSRTFWFIPILSVSFLLTLVNADQGGVLLPLLGFASSCALTLTSLFGLSFNVFEKAPPKVVLKFTTLSAISLVLIHLEYLLLSPSIAPVVAHFILGMVALLIIIMTFGLDLKDGGDTATKEIKDTQTKRRNPTDTKPKPAKLDLPQKPNIVADANPDKQDKWG